MFHRAEFLGPSLKTAMQVAAHQQLLPPRVHQLLIRPVKALQRKAVGSVCVVLVCTSMTALHSLWIPGRWRQEQAVPLLISSPLGEKKISCFEWDGCSRNSSGFSSKFDPDFHLVAKVTDSLEDSCHSEVSGPRPGGIRGVV
ncbi:hypothetical protein SETIT_9G180200v2 [Setaria italica]|uniref:Uncharacterized protein n=1 Tax=Setaria italica TaxID=4555 RepID=A0A368SHV3_SETIT|nr:hypothetical protein SETIT_9G180200v2 [Setaria italica]